MASLFIEQDRSPPQPAARPSRLAGLSDSSKAIQGAGFDAVFFWGCPLVALLAVKAWLALAITQSAATADAMTQALWTFSIVITYAHLIAVVPRAYLNREVYAANKLRLTVTPVLLIAALSTSTTALAIGSIVAIFWDIHHSAMQNFGLARIYDLKAGNTSDRLRTTDLRLNWFLYVGPLVAGACLMLHVHALDRLDQTALKAVAQLPGILQTQLTAISAIASILWAGALLWAVADYRKAIAEGYHVPPHKLALTVTTGFVSFIAWGFSSPIVAFVSINVYHAVQYFALVWLKEGGRMGMLVRGRKWIAMLLFGAMCLSFGIAYRFVATANIKWITGIFVSCSILHFWYDSFIWSVRKRQV